jgi:hypothetical protein
MLNVIMLHVVEPFIFFDEWSMPESENIQNFTLRGTFRKVY